MKKKIGFWKSKKNTDMKKELSLLKKMRKVDERIQLKIVYVCP